MKAPDMIIINQLKRELSRTIIENNYNLLSPEVLALSKMLDNLLIPLFKKQLETIQIN